MFEKDKYRVPEFYPRDLKRRLDQYVVGQDRAKKIICSTIFNHYQNLQRRAKFEDDDHLVWEKKMRQSFAKEQEGRSHNSQDIEGLETAIAN